MAEQFRNENDNNTKRAGGTPPARFVFNGLQSAVTVYRTL